MKRKINIYFLGFWPSFNYHSNFITAILKKHYDVIIDPRPDYLFYTRYDSAVYAYDCVRIFYNVENFVPDFNLCDYAIGFDEITFLDRCIRYPLYLITDYQYYPGDDYARDFMRMEEKTQFTMQDLQAKKSFCGMVVSRGGCVERDTFFEQLSQYKTVLSGGAWKNNVGGRVTDKYQFLKMCKFSIAFENSSTPGYTTEKLMQAFAAATIPIYFGNPNVAEEFNTKSFVNAHDFCTWEDVITRIREIDNNDDLYYSMMKETALLPGYAAKKRKELEDFLVHIINQEPAKAIRRHGQVIRYYETRYKFCAKVWDMRGKLAKARNHILPCFRNGK